MASEIKKKQTDSKSVSTGAATFENSVEPKKLDTQELDL
jgi:hypothetical protein